tara:strand:- start:2203 stop:3603 length:1401 start_codon:yes stop_codon:yes gene_type:complete
MVINVIFTLSGALLSSFAFEPVGLWWSAILGLILFFRALKITRYPILISFAYGLILNASVLIWSGKYVGLLPWLALSLLQGFFYLPVGLAYRRSRNLWWAIVALLLMEEVRSHFPFGGFGWTRVAFSQSESPLVPVVAYGGVLLLTFLTLASALLLACPSIGKVLTLAAITLIAILLPGNPQGSGEIKVIAIQGNTPRPGLDFNSRAKEVFSLHEKATREFANSQFDVIIWPENAIDIDPSRDSDLRARIYQLTNDFQTPLISGVVLDGQTGPQNASVMYGVGGQIESTYIKRSLTPFGEYIPWRTLAQWASPLARTVKDFAPGVDRVVHLVNGAAIGPVICYEIIKDELVRDMAMNSKMLIVHTNSATFVGTAQSAQQLAITRIRAIEHSRTIVSVSTVGLSAIIDNNGVVIKQIPPDVQGVLSGIINLNEHQTFADKFSGWSSSIVILFAVVIAFLQRRRESYL